MEEPKQQLPTEILSDKKDNMRKKYKMVSDEEKSFNLSQNNSNIHFVNQLNEKLSKIENKKVGVDMGVQVFTENPV